MPPYYTYHYSFFWNIEFQEGSMIAILVSVPIVE